MDARDNIGPRVGNRIPLAGARAGAKTPKPRATPSDGSRGHAAPIAPTGSNSSCASPLHLLC
eukprot:1119224-Lingulodinium_polyedra.AAC.1